MAGLFGKGRRERELSEEMDTHVALHISDNLRAGMSREEARRQALLALGGLEQTKEAFREQRGLPLLETLFQDARYATRVLRKSPGFTAVAVITLALGIASATTVFSIVNAALLQPLRYGHPERLALVWAARPNGGFSNPGTEWYLAWRERAKSFEQLAGLGQRPLVLRGNPPVLLGAAEATANFFTAVDVQPQLGRVFTEEEARSGVHVVVLSHAVWANRFASDRNILGKAITLSGEPWTVIGVMPADFSFFRSHDVWVPLELARGRTQHGGSLLVVGKLRPGVSFTQASAEMEALQAQLAREMPDVSESRYSSARVMPLRSVLLGQGARQMMLVLLGAVGFVLLIACANIANLLLARGATRQKEIAMRLSLGATRVRIVRQLLVEASLLALLGAAAGLLIANWAVRSLATLPLLQAPGAPRIAIDSAVLAFVAGVTCLATLIAGMLPAWQSSQVTLVESTKSQTAGGTGSVRHVRMRSALVAGEIALSVMLLAGAGLLVRSLRSMLRVDPGFKPAGVLTMDVMLAQRNSDEAVRDFYDRVLQRVRALPGVDSAGVCTTLPLIGWNYGIGYRSVDQPKAAIQRQNANLQVISDGYFRTLRLSMVGGRAFTAEDTPTSLPVVILNRHLAERLFHSDDVIGKVLVVGSPHDKSETARQIVGVAGDVKDFSVDQPASDDIYLPFEQAPTTAEYLVLHSNGDLKALVGSVRAAIAALDPDQPIEDIATMQERLDDSLSSARFSASLLGAFALLSLGLAAIGIYGVIAYTTAQRTAEFGLRMALGAEPRSLLRLVLGGGMRLVALGCAAGLAGALVIVRLLGSAIYGVSPYDPLAFSSALACILAAAMTAMLLPARRATRVDPMVALRYE